MSTNNESQGQGNSSSERAPNPIGRYLTTSIVLALTLGLGFGNYVQIYQMRLELHDAWNSQHQTVNSIFDGARVDQDECEKEVESKLATVTLQGIRSVLKPYRECLERRARVQRKAIETTLLTSKDI